MMEKKAGPRRVLIAFPSSLQQSGGMEHACCALANALQDSGHTVRISPLYGGKPRLFYKLHPGVELGALMRTDVQHFSSPYIGRCVPVWGKIVREMLRPFSKNRALQWSEWCQAQLLRESIHSEIGDFRPDVIISFKVSLTYILRQVVGDAVPIVTSLRFNPEHLLKDLSKRDRKSLNQTGAVHVLMPSFVETVRRYGIRRSVVCIPLAIPQYEANTTLREKKSKYTIINVARIEKNQKRQHLLVEAFAQIADAFPDWQVEFWGDDRTFAGGYTGELQAMIRQYHLEDRVFVRGVTQDIASVYARSDIFCFPSAFEGFGNALGEAMSAGLPAVGYASCPAVNELIVDGETGFLVEDGPAPLAQALKKLMAAPELRAQMGMGGHDRMEKCTPDIITKAWEKLLAEVTRGQ